MIRGGIRAPDALKGGENENGPRRARSEAGAGARYWIETGAIARAMLASPRPWIARS
jgi:hypothetical protein